MHRNHWIHLTALPLVMSLSGLLAAAQPRAKKMTIKGYVIDSSCTFTRNLSKPISPACARACARAGSPLVIETAHGKIFWPIAGSKPAAGQNRRLLPYAGRKVEATGKVYYHDGSAAIVIATIRRAR